MENNKTESSNLFDFQNENESSLTIPSQDENGDSFKPPELKLSSSSSNIFEEKSSPVLNLFSNSPKNFTRKSIQTPNLTASSIFIPNEDFSALNKSSGSDFENPFDYSSDLNG